MGKKAVVLGGGGSRGSYQVGVWKALRELDFDYKIVTGTSVGALNGALMVQNDYELAQKMWQKLKTRDVMDVAVTDKIEGRKDLTSKVSAFISEIVKTAAPIRGRWSRCCGLILMSKNCALRRWRLDL